MLLEAQIVILVIPRMNRDFLFRRKRRRGRGDEEEAMAAACL